MNRAPTKGFERHVGARTTLDFVNSFPHLRNLHVLPRLDTQLVRRTHIGLQATTHVGMHACTAIIELWGACNAVCDGLQPHAPASRCTA